MKGKMKGMHQMPDGEMMPDAEMKGKKHQGQMKKEMANHEKAEKGVDVPWKKMCK